MKRYFAVWLFLLATCLVATAEDKPVATIALLSDPHTMLGTNQNAAVYQRHFEEAMEAVNEAKVDFVLITGDLSNDSTTNEWQEFRRRIKRLNAPVYYVPGNHDVGHKKNSGKKNGTITPEQVKSYERVMGPSFFAKDAHGVRIIGLNSSLLGSGFKREGDQWKFLEKELGKSAAKPKVLFMHYPLFVTNVAEPGGGYWNIEPEPRQRLLELCKQAKVKAVLTGHLHRPMKNEDDGILFLGTPAIAFGFPRNAHKEGWTLVTIPKSGPVTFERKKLEEK